MIRQTERKAYQAHTDIPLIVLVAVMSLMGIVAVCVATYTPDSSPDVSFLNHVVESSYTMRQCLFVLVAPLVV
jgi:rod shape determining protein RodA